MKTNTKILEDITVYDPIVKHVAEKLDTFTAEHVRLVAEAKELPMPEKNSQWETCCVQHNPVAYANQ